LRQWCGTAVGTVVHMSTACQPLEALRLEASSVNMVGAEGVLRPPPDGVDWIDAP